jgi:hypothetical protein
VLRNGRFVMRDTERREKHSQACRTAGLLARLEEMWNKHRSFIARVFLV